MNNIELTDLFNRELMIFDGAMGTELYRRHVFTNRCYDELCLSDPRLVMDIHQDYLRAGADVLTSNSYGANRFTLKKFGLADKVSAINQKAVGLMKESVAALNLQRRILLAGSLGPLGLTAQDDCTPEEGADILAEQARALIEGGADFLILKHCRIATRLCWPSRLWLVCLRVLPLSFHMQSQMSGDLPELLAHRLQPLPAGLPEPFTGA